MEEKNIKIKSSSNTFVEAGKVAFIICGTMTLYEVLKQFLSPDISIWESHVVTIIFSTIISYAAAYFVLGKQQIINKNLQEVISLKTKAEEEKRIERQRMYSLLNTLPAFVYLQASDHSIKFANKYYKDRFGETEGVPCYQSLWGRDKPCEPCPTFKVFDTKKPQVWEWDSAPDGHIYRVYDYLFTDSDDTECVLELGIDVTEQKNIEKDRETLIKKLEKALLEIKTLQDILPICSICKNIRNDEGYYEQIEEYIHRHTGADFSHTICHPCMKKHYPEEYESIMKNKSGN